MSCIRLQSVMERGGFGGSAHSAFLYHLAGAAREVASPCFWFEAGMQRAVMPRWEKAAFLFLSKGAGSVPPVQCECQDTDGAARWGLPRERKLLSNVLDAWLLLQ